MHKRLFLSALLIVCIGLGIGLGSFLSGQSEALQVQLVQANALDKAPVTVSDTPTPSEPAHTSPSKQQAPLSAAALLDTFRRRATETLHAGWLHIHEEKQFPPGTDNGILPNGKRIPASQINDTWVHLDGKGNVIESVFIMRSADGDIVQVGVRGRGGQTWNSATGESGVWEPAPFEPYDYGLVRDVQVAEERGAQVSVRTNSKSLNGSPGTEILVSETFIEPLSTVDSEQPLTGVTTRAVFDPQTGYLLLREVIFTKQDGSSEAFPRSTFAYAYDEPPAEVLTYLKQVEKSQ